MLVATLLTFLQLRSGVDSYFIVVAAMAAFGYMVMASGRLLFVAAGGREFDPCAAYVLGLLATCLAVYALSAVFPLTAAAAFAAAAAVVIALEIALARKHRAPPTDRRALTGFALCVAFTAAWCSAPAGAYEVLRTQGALPVWGDYFIHGGRISQFGDVRALGRGSIYLADFPSSFYHFASYLSAAALAGMLNQPGLLVATSVWLPLGFLATTAGAYALGARLAGAAGGIAALAALAILPDASHYGLGNGLFSFHWALLSQPGGTYALGACFLSLVFLDRWNLERSRAALVASALFATSVIVFRAHVFALYFPAWLATAAFCRAPQDRRKGPITLVLVAALGAAAVATSLILAHLASTDPAFWRFGGPALSQFLFQAHTAQEPTAYTGFYYELFFENSAGISLAVGIVLVFVAALGAWLVLLPGAFVLVRRYSALRPIDAFPGFLAFCYLLLILFAPVPWHGDSTELTHRPFVLLYAAAAIWTLCLMLRRDGMRGGQGANRLWPAMFTCALFALPALVISAEGMAYPKPHWAKAHITLRAEPGLLEAAAFLRKHARAGDIFATAGLNTEYAVVDFPTKVCALSGVPAYLSRPYLEMIKDARRKEVVAGRLAALKEVDQQAEYGEAIELLRRLHVQWYVVADGQGPRWDPRRERAAFSASIVSLYTTSKLRPDADTSPSTARQ